MNEPPKPASEPQEPRPTAATEAVQGTVQPPRRMYRDPHGPIGGVAGGFAGYFNIDPVITRLIWVVALFSGIGCPAYLLCWVVIPKAKTWPPRGEPVPPSARVRDPNDKAMISGLVIVALAALIGAGTQGLGDYLLPAALVGFGVFLLTQRSANLSPGPNANPNPGPNANPNPNREGGAPPPPGDFLGVLPTRASVATTEFEEPEPTGLVTPTVLSLLAIGLGVIIAIRSAGILNVPVVAAASGALVLVGVGLLASLWLGRARGLVPLGLGLVVLILAASALESLGHSEHFRRFRETMGAHPDMDAAVGDQTYAPKVLSELKPRYDLAMGKLTVDLGELDLHGEIRDLTIDLGMGDATLIVPPDVEVVVRGHVGMGEAHLFGRKRDGMGVNFKQEEPGRGAGLLNVDVSIGAGKWDVHRSR